MLKSTASGKIKVTKAFREKHGAKYARAGINLGKTYPNEGALMADMFAANLTDEQATLLARELGWLDD